MTIAAKHLDPVIGVDVHIVLIPSPAGPIPTPIPHPYIGIVLDPFDYLPFIGATVYVNGLPRASAGTSGQAIPSHIPMGGAFLKPPTNESEVFMGSATVLSDGEPQSFLAMPILSCQDVGMPAPPRLKKKNVAKSLLLPTTMVLAIPMGAPVLIGGPPTISMTAMAMHAGKFLLGKLLGRLRKIKGINRRLKALSKWLRDMVDRLGKKLHLGDGARNAIKRGICTLTGHPVDVATGKVLTERVDFALPGPIPFKLERVWYSTSTYRGPLGHGWHHSYDTVLHVTDEVLMLQTVDGRHVGLPPLLPGASYFDPGERITVKREPNDRYSVQGVDGLSYHFARHTAPGGVGARNTAPPPLTREHKLEAIRDRAGNELSFTRDARGQLVGIVDSAGRFFELENDDEGRIRSISAPHPDKVGQRVTVVTYRYDRHGDLIESRDAHGQSMRYAYESHLLVQETDRAGLSFYFAYDGKDETAKCVRTWGDSGIYDHKLSYDDLLQVTTVENSLGHKTLYEHQGGLVIRTVDPLGATSLVSYDAFAQKLSETDANGLTTTYAYDERGNLLEVVGPDGAKVALAYNGDDRPVEVMDAVGGKWAFTYDSIGQLLERSDPLGRRVRLAYAKGLVSSVADPEEHATTLGYDAQRSLETITTPDQVVTRYLRDTWGRPIALIDGKGNVQRRTYDLLNQVLRVEEPDGNVRTLQYDAEGRVIHAKDLQHDVEFGYRGMGRLAHRTEAKTTVRFEYDTEEQLTGIQNEHGHVYSFKLDPRGEVEVESGFDGVRRIYTRDLGGRVRVLTRPSGLTSSYSYDGASRVTKVEHSDGAKESYAYRRDGALLAANNGDCTLSFERDLLGRIVKETQGAHWVASSYALSGLRSELRSSLGAHQRIARNVMGDVTRVETGDGSFAAQFKRDALGLELERSLPGGVRARWSRDNLGRPIQHQVTSGLKNLRARAYTWEANDRLRMVIDVMQGPVQYGHDALGNLAYAKYADGTVDLRLPDAVGNLFKREDRGDRTYGPGGQLLEARGAEGLTRYTYDAEGNLITKEEPGRRVWRYAWNAAGMLAKVTRPDGREVTFTYDALGRRIKKSYRGKTTLWVWDGNVPLHEWVELTDAQAARDDGAPTADADAIAHTQREAQLSAQPAQAPPSALRADQGTKNSPITWLFEPESFSPMAKLVGEERHAIVTDHLGTPVSMLNARGEETWAADIDTYGALRGLRGERTACPFRWPGQYEDVETGLYYNRFRYYDPESGQYCSQDPIGLAGGRALYSYPRDSLVLLDPLGLSCVRDTRVGPSSHLEQFEGGASFVMTRDQYNRFVFGKPSVGRADGLFVTTKTNMDKIMRESGGDIGEIERRLGFDAGHFSSGGGLARGDIANPGAHNARMPSGLESGANPHFKYGGYTDGGAPEAVVDPVPTSSVAFSFM
jgi:RHS repeat-associated protein